MMNQPDGDSSRLGCYPMDRKDRKGYDIKKGSKKHHITFKDQLPAGATALDHNEPFINGASQKDDDMQARSIQGLVLSTSSYDSDSQTHEQNFEEGKDDDNPKKSKRRTLREPLHEIIFVESYKEYNQNNPMWYSNQCC